VSAVEKKLVKKVYAYVLRKTESGYQLLVFKHLHFPEAGIQIPGGTVEVGESPFVAVKREVYEESGLNHFEFIQELGVTTHDMRSYDIEELHERHYFHVEVLGSTDCSWTGYEESPSDGSPGPIALRFYWVSLEAIPPLAGKTDEMLPVLINRIKNTSS